MPHEESYLEKIKLAATQDGTTSVDHTNSAYLGHSVANSDEQLPDVPTGMSFKGNVVYHTEPIGLITTHPNANGYQGLHFSGAKTRSQPTKLDAGKALLRLHKKIYTPGEK